MKLQFLAPILLCHLLAAGQQPSSNPNEWVRRAVDDELRAEENDKSHWMFTLRTQKAKEGIEVDEVVETEQGDLKLPLVVNGRKLAATESDRQMQHLLQDQHALQKSLKDKNEDASKSQQLLKLLPDAFIFKYADRRGQLIRFTFSPNPKFKATNRESQVFHAMSGSIWFDSKQMRLREMSGRLGQEVKFGEGLLGHLDPGGTFDVKQSQAAPGFWELAVLDVNMRGKALFFKSIDVQQKVSRSGLKKLPDNLSLQSAAEMLQRKNGKHSGT